jgi:hypothetical protein
VKEIDVCGLSERALGSMSTLKDKVVIVTSLLGVFVCTIGGKQTFGGG